MSMLSDEVEVPVLNLTTNEILFYQFLRIGDNWIIVNKRKNP